MLNKTVMVKHLLHCIREGSPDRVSTRDQWSASHDRTCGMLWITPLVGGVPGFIDFGWRSALGLIGSGAPGRLHGSVRWRRMSVGADRD
jgi:hypothetical protein